MKSNTACLPAVARRNQASRRPIVSGSAEMSGTKTDGKPAKAVCVARTKAATLLTRSPGERTVSALARRPSKVTMKNNATNPRGANDERVASRRSRSPVHVDYTQRPRRSRGPPSPAAGGLDHEEVVATEFQRYFGGKPAPTSAAHEGVLPRATVVPALEAFRPKDPALREDRRGPLAGQEPDGTANSVSSRIAAPASGSGDEPVFFDPERVCELEGFDGRVEGIRHVRVDARHAGPVRECALAARDRLVVRERPRIRSADGQIVHRSLALGGDRIGQRIREREEEDVDDPLRRLDVPRRDGPGRPRPDQAPLPREHPQRPEGTRISRRVRVRQASHDVRSGAQSDGERPVQIAGDLTIRSFEVNRNLGAADRDFRVNPDPLRFFGRCPFEELFCRPGSSRQFANRCADPPLSVIEELVDRLPMPRDADSLDEFDEPARPELVGGDLRSEVSESLQGIRRFPAESLENGPPLASSVHHFLRF